MSLKTENLYKRYGKGELEVTVLSQLNLEIEDGEFVAIIGPSGAGKLSQMPNSPDRLNNFKYQKISDSRRFFDIA
jgi:ABC-type phosphate/phosphonate transport system ATPase subunit